MSIDSNGQSSGDQINKLNYRLKQVLKNFDEMENKTNEEIKSLKAQKAKDDYRINVLLKTIEGLEKQLKK